MAQLCVKNIFYPLSSDIFIRFDEPINIEYKRVMTRVVQFKLTCIYYKTSSQDLIFNLIHPDRIDGQYNLQIWIQNDTID